MIIMLNRNKFYKVKKDEENEMYLYYSIDDFGNSGLFCNNN